VFEPEVEVGAEGVFRLLHSAVAVVVVVVVVVAVVAVVAVVVH